MMNKIIPIMFNKIYIKIYVINKTIPLMIIKIDKMTHKRLMIKQNTILILIKI
jgi:hypothetical protein